MKYILAFNLHEKYLYNTYLVVVDDIPETLSLTDKELSDFGFSIERWKEIMFNNIYDKKDLFFIEFEHKNKLNTYEITAHIRNNFTEILL